MKRSVVLVLVATIAASLACVGGLPQLSLVARLPGSLSAQLTFDEWLALEVGMAVTGPAVFAAKAYLLPWRLGRLSLVPAIGLGGAVAFLPGDLVAWGAYGIAGLEWPIAKTRVSLVAELVIILPLPVGVGTFSVGPQIGVRFDF
jgi:hypothetical protein